MKNRICEQKTRINSLLWYWGFTFCILKHMNNTLVCSFQLRNVYNAQNIPTDSSAALPLLTANGTSTATLKSKNGNSISLLKSKMDFFIFRKLCLFDVTVLGWANVSCRINRTLQTGALIKLKLFFKLQT